ncbi:MAG: hypothetical protein QXJ58_06695 [Archaeoglobaceae archaeon]
MRQKKERMNVMISEEVAKAIRVKAALEKKKPGQVIEECVLKCIKEEGKT